jgi:hypothetical protein
LKLTAKCCICFVHLEVDRECGDFSVAHYRTKFRAAAINYAKIIQEEIIQEKAARRRKRGFGFADR